MAFALAVLGVGLACDSQEDVDPKASAAGSAGNGAGSNPGGAPPAAAGTQSSSAGVAATQGGHAGSAGGASGGNAGSAAVAGSGAGGSGVTTPLAGTPIVFVSGTGGGGKLRTYDLDKASGALTPRGGDFDAGPQPSYLALDPSRTHLYVASADGSAAGGVLALDIGANGALMPVNRRAGSDGGFAHVAVDPAGRFVLAASFDGGSVSVFPIASAGGLEPEIASRDFGDGSEAHAVGFDQTGRYVLVPARGNDHVEQLVLADDGMLAPNTPAFASAANGAGPRHIAVHPNGKLAFVINELDSTVTSYALSAQGTLTAQTTISSLPAGFVGQNSGAHIELSPDGRFAYASNRGHDSIAAYAVDASSGELTLIEHEATRGQTPRDFDVDPNGDVLIVANQQSDTLSVFALEADGSLRPLGSTVPAPASPRAVQIHYLPP